MDISDLKSASQRSKLEFRKKMKNVAEVDQLQFIMALKLLPLVVLQPLKPYRYTVSHKKILIIFE